MELMKENVSGSKQGLKLLPVNDTEDVPLTFCRVVRNLQQIMSGFCRGEIGIRHYDVRVLFR